MALLKMEKIKMLKYTGMGVHLKVNNIARSREFYEDLLDMEPVFGYGDDDFRRTLPNSIPSVMDDGFPGAPEKYRGVTYEPSQSSPFEIAEGHIAVPDRDVYEIPVQGPKISAMVKVESLVPLICDKNFKPSFPVRQYYWGTIEAAFKDPDGFVLVLIAPQSDAELEQLRTAVKVETVSP